MSDWSRVILGDFWVKLGCFLTGHSYTLISGSSEASRKVVRKYMSAFVLISLIWFTVGYLLTTRYFVRDNFWFGLLSGLIAVIIVINVERTIVLGTNVSNWAKGLRVFLAVIIALIGATVIDQIIFEEDVAKYKKDHVSEAIQQRIESEDAIIGQSIGGLINTKAALNNQLTKLEQEISERPVVVGSTQTEYRIVETTEGLKRVPTKRSQNIPNPAIESSNRIRLQISQIDERIGNENNKRVQLREIKSNEYFDDSGFLQELDILVKVITASSVALVVYILWMALLLIIELLVLIIKTGDAGNDYDLLIQHQVDIKKSRIKSLR
jgi:hypothetical protein